MLHRCTEAGGNTSLWENSSFCPLNIRNYVVFIRVGLQGREWEFGGLVQEGVALVSATSE